jgi:hypothetical protein
MACSLLPTILGVIAASLVMCAAGATPSKLIMVGEQDKRLADVLSFPLDDLLTPSVYVIPLPSSCNTDCFQCARGYENDQHSVEIHMHRFFNHYPLTVKSVSESELAFFPFYTYTCHGEAAVRACLRGWNCL